MRLPTLLSTAVSAALFLIAHPASGAIPGNMTFTHAFQTEGKNRLINPVWMAEIPGKPKSFLVLEIKSGNIWALTPTGAEHTKSLFVKVATNPSGTMGLVGMAFHPDFVRNRKYYLDYNPQGATRTLRIEERIASEDYLKDSGTPPRTILSIPMPAEFTGHQGGNVQFGRDGFLYIAIGDGGMPSSGGADPQGHAQKRSDLLGKILRIDVDRTEGSQAYAVPADNPFVADPDATVRREIWAYGFRNPWRFSFDRDGSIWVGDVGLNSFEEIDIVRKGENLGWNLKEGERCLNQAGCNAPGLVPPLLSLAPDSARCIVGGMVFHGVPGSAFDSVYFFADFLSLNLWGLRQSGRKIKEIARVGKSPTGFVALVQDGEGNLYGVAHDAGAIYRINHPELKPVPISARRPQGVRAGRAEMPDPETFRPDGRALEEEGVGAAVPALRKP
jgi:glucose/arabinose dehydrogenase